MGDKKLNSSLQKISQKEEFSDCEEEKHLPNSVCEVKKALETKISTAYPDECLGFLERCLRVKDYDIEKAAKLAFGVQQCLVIFTEMFKSVTWKSLEPMFSSGVITVLKGKDVHGRQVIFMRFGRWHPKEFDFDKAAAALVFLFIWILGRSKEVQRNGIIFFHDLRDFGLEQIRGVKINRLTMLLKLMQDSAPGKIKAVRLLYHPRIFGYLFKLCRPFMKQKLASRIEFHGDDVSSLNEHLHQEILPVSLGGYLSEDEAIDNDLLGAFLKDDSYWNEIVRLGFPKQ